MGLKNEQRNLEEEREIFEESQYLDEMDLKLISKNEEQERKMRNNQKSSERRRASHGTPSGGRESWPL